MKKHGLLKFIIIVVLIILVIGGLFLAFYFINGGKSPIDIINNLSNDNGVNDNYNGIYVYKEDLNGAKYIYAGCSVSTIDYYVLVVNDDFYSFKSSCMGTYPIEEGKTEKLEIKENEEKTNFVLRYKDHDYVKNNSIDTIETNNMIADKLSDINLTNYELILRETEFEGNYYDISARINNLSIVLMFTFNKLEDNTFDIQVKNGDTSVYKYNIKNYDILPLFYTYGKTLAVIEPTKSSDNSKFAYKFKAMNNNGIVYDLDKMFPITVNGVTLTADNSVYVTYNSSQRYFTLLVGYDDKMCVENSQNTNITYYEFKIEYDYLHGSFSTPVFVKYGRENEGCNYINRFMGR